MKSVTFFTFSFTKLSLFVVVFLNSVSLSAAFLPVKQNSIDFKTSSPYFSDLLILKVEMVDGKKIVRISFNGNEGVDAEMNFYNAKNQLVHTANFELIKSPYYASVDVSAMAPGKYSVVLSTQKGKHNATFQLN